MRTPLTYYGGKQGLSSQIVPLFPSHRIYLEPFAGGAATLFAKPRAERETLNDLDGTIMRFWRALRDRPDELAAAVASTPYGRQEWRDSRDHGAEDDVEAARRLLVEVDRETRQGAGPLVHKVRDEAWSRRQEWRAKLTKAVEAELEKRGIRKGAAAAAAADADDPWGKTWNAVYDKVKPIYRAKLDEKYRPHQQELLGSALELLERLIDPKTAVEPPDAS